MKVTLETIVNSKEAITELIKEKVPVDVAWDIRKNLRLIEPEVAEYEDLRSQLIIEKYGVEDKRNPGDWRVRPSMLKEFQEEVSILANKEVELDIKKVKLPKTTMITTVNLYLLEWMIDFEEEAMEGSPAR